MPTTKNTPKKKARATTPRMSKTHKDALANGRVEGRVIREYLEIVEATKPRRGRRRTSESISKRLAVIAAELKTTDPVTKVRLIQERLDLRTELASMKSKNEVAAATVSNAFSGSTTAIHAALNSETWVFGVFKSRSNMEKLPGIPC